MRHSPVILCCFLLWMMAWSALAAAPLTVLYPQVKAPYDDIFKQIVRGIEHQYQGDMQLQQLDASTSLPQVAKDLRTDTNTMVIALGKSGYQVAQQIQHSNSVVIGALPIQPAGLAGISLLTDPKVLFNSLKMLAPSINKVHVLYSDSSHWLINLAIDQGQLQGLEVIAQKVTDLKDAVRQYQELWQNIDPRTTAIWLPLDPVSVNEQIILPKILEVAWERNIVLFSSKPEHAKRGVLFSTFPDHFELGRELVLMVEQLHQAKITATVRPLQQVQLAVNLRTAAHLGMEYKPEVLRQIAITFK